LFEMNGTLNGLKDDRLQALYDRVYSGVAVIPGVISASVSRYGLLSGDLTGDGITVPGRKDSVHADIHYIFPGYFQTMRVPLLVVRGFIEADTAWGRLGVSANRAFASMAFGTDSALGRTRQFENKCVTVIGLAADVRFDDIRTPPPRTVYVPFRQHSQHVAT